MCALPSESDWLRGRIEYKVVPAAAPILVYSSSRSGNVCTSSVWAAGGDDGIIVAYSGGGGKYGGGGTLVLGSTAASSISLSKLYLFRSPAMRFCLGVFCQLHIHRMIQNKIESPTAPPRAMATTTTGLR